MEKVIDIFATLTPAEGMYLYNGTTIASIVHAPKDSDLSVWREIDTAEKESIEKEQQAAAEAAVKNKDKEQ